MSTWEERRNRLKAYDAFLAEHQACGDNLNWATHDDGAWEGRCERCTARIVIAFEPGDIPPPPVL